MSLSTFHLLFIGLSVILSAFVAAWAIGQYRLDGAVGYVAAAVLSLGGGGVLMVYGLKVRRKLARF
jgi:hypothetical protein